MICAKPPHGANLHAQHPWPQHQPPSSAVVPHRHDAARPASQHHDDRMPDCFLPFEIPWLVQPDRKSKPDAIKSTVKNPLFAESVALTSRRAHQPHAILLSQNYDLPSGGQSQCWHWPTVGDPLERGIRHQRVRVWPGTA